MNIHYKLYLSIGLLFSAADSMAGYMALSAESNMVLTEDDCDEILHAVFEKCFFNDKDTTPFSEIVTRIIEIFKIKMQSFDQQSQQKCKNFIALLEKNKNVCEFATWASILVGSELINLLPHKTQKYLNEISNFKKTKTLINKLKNK